MSRSDTELLDGLQKMKQDPRFPTWEITVDSEDRISSIDLVERPDPDEAVPRRTIGRDEDIRVVLEEALDYLGL